MSTLILALFALAAQAETVKCRIMEAKFESPLSAFIGGSVRVHLAEGITTFYGTEGERLVVLGTDHVSSWKAPREKCNYALETIRYSDGTLRAKLFHFRDCVHRVPEQNLLGYIDADVGFDLTSGFGSYREIFKTPSGVVPTDFVEFEGCAFTK